MAVGKVNKDGNFIQKLFGGISMNWRNVITMAVIAGLYTGLINQVPFLKETSFQDIAITFEWWILFAVIIAVNCVKPVESGLKTFVFFLISQPLVYLVETPFIGTSVWGYYRYWLIITVLTLPGGMVLNLIKKQNLLGGLVAAAAMSMLMAQGADHGFQTVFDFPHHLLSLIFCILVIAAIAVYVIKNKRYRILALLIALVVGIASCAYTMNVENSDTVIIPSGQWSCSLSNDAGCRVIVSDGTLDYYYKAYSKDNEITLKNSKGKILKYKVTFAAGHTPVIKVMD